MKSKLALVVVLLATIINCSAQKFTNKLSLPDATTEDEYNYLTKGNQTQIKSGLGPTVLVRILGL